jgi:hypothetical protein
VKAPGTDTIRTFWFAQFLVVSLIAVESHVNKDAERKRETDVIHRPPSNTKSVTRQVSKSE